MIPQPSATWPSDGRQDSAGPPRVVAVTLDLLDEGVDGLEPGLAPQTVHEPHPGGSP